MVRLPIVQRIADVQRLDHLERQADGVLLRFVGVWTYDQLTNMFSCFPFFGPGPSLTPQLGSVSVRVF